MPHEEYVRLETFDQEATLLRIKLRKVISVLEGGLVAPPQSFQGVESVANDVVDDPVCQKVVSVVMAEAVVADLKPAERSPEANAAEAKPSSCARNIEYQEKLFVPIPPMLQKFLVEQDSSERLTQLIKTCVQQLSSLYKKRITLSLEKPYICLWDFDEWKTFAFGEIVNGRLYLSIEKIFVQDACGADMWIPPDGLCKKPLVRLKIDAVDDLLITRLKEALFHVGTRVSDKV